jgi:hypothetical protein
LTTPHIQHKNSHGKLGAIRVQEDGTFAPYSGFVPVWLLVCWLHDQTVEEKELCRGEEFSSVVSELVSRIPPGRILRFFAD